MPIEPPQVRERHEANGGFCNLSNSRVYVFQPALHNCRPARNVPANNNWYRDKVPAYLLCLVLSRIHPRPVAHAHASLRTARLRGALRAEGTRGTRERNARLQAARQLAVRTMWPRDK